VRDRIAIIDIATKKFKALSYKQYDENNLLQIVVTKNKEVVDISEYKAYVYFELPSGTIYELTPNIANNTIDILLSSKILNEHGKVTFEIELRKFEEVITVFSMYLNVEKSINEENTPIEPGQVAPSIRHSHNNKDILDRITSEMLDKIDDVKIDLSDYMTKEDFEEQTEDYATEEYVMNKIDEAKIRDENGEKVDLSRFATKEQVDKKADNLFKTDIMTVAPLGGIGIGDNLNNQSIQDLLTKLLFPYVEPTIHAELLYHPNVLTLEFGEKIMVEGMRVHVGKKSEDILSLSFLRDGYILDSYSKDVAEGGVFEKIFSYPVEIIRPISNTYFQARVMDKKETIVFSNTVAFNFYYPYYYGIIEEDAMITDTLILDLNKQVCERGNKTYTFSPRNQRILIAYPKTYGRLKSILDPNGFEQLASFYCIELEIPCLDNTNQIYYVYYNRPSTNRNFKMSFYY
jgi:hypothetical protein